MTTANQNVQKEDVPQIGTGLAITLLVLYVLWWIWAIMGIVAFVWSLICLGKSGSPTDKTIGIILAVLFGPFYFLFVKYNKSYCR